MEQNEKKPLGSEQREKDFSQDKNISKELDYRKKRNNMIQSYFIVTQIIFNVLTPAIIGWIIGYEINDKTVIARGVGALIGAFLGFAVNAVFLTRYYKKVFKSNDNKKK